MPICIKKTTPSPPIFLSTRLLDLRVHDDHNVISPAVDVAFLHDDLLGGDSAERRLEANLALEGRLDDVICVAHHLMRAGLQHGNQNVDVVSVDWVCAVSCRALWERCSYTFISAQKVR